MPSECYYLWGYMCYKDMPDPGNQRLDLSIKYRSKIRILYDSQVL